MFYYRDLRTYEYCKETYDNRVAPDRMVYEIRKAARIRNRYNQVPHLSLDTKWESNKTTINITK